MDIKEAKLGHTFSQTELKENFRLIYGGVSWPHKRPGFAVILGMSRKKHFDTYDIYLLDEFESDSPRTLVRQCGVLDFKYKPSFWIGDPFNSSADQFIQEMNDESRKIHRREFAVSSSPVMKMDFPYPYLLDTLRTLLEEKSRTLFLKDSQVKDYLRIEASETIATLEPGSYPAIEALAYAVIEMRYSVQEEYNFRGYQPQRYDYDPTYIGNLRDTR